MRSSFCPMAPAPCASRTSMPRASRRWCPRWRGRGEFFRKGREAARDSASCRQHSIAALLAGPVLPCFVCQTSAPLGHGHSEPLRATPSFSELVPRRLLDVPQNLQCSWLAPARHKVGLLQRLDTWSSFG